VNPVGISQTEIATFQRCPRMWYLKYYLGMVPAEEPPVGARILGIRVHAALEGWYGYGLMPNETLLYLYGIALRQRPEYAAELQTELHLATTMVNGYLEHVASEGWDSELEVVSVERELRVGVPGVPGVDFRGRLDQVYRNHRSGTLGFMDYKTGASMERHDDLALDPQMPFYCLLQQLAAHGGEAVINGNGYRSDRVIIGGGTIRTLRRVLRTEKSKPPYYQTDTFSYTPEQIRAELSRATAIVTRIMQARHDLDAAMINCDGRQDYMDVRIREILPPTKIVGDCSWRCEFAKVCPMMDDGSDWPGVLVRSGRYVAGDPYSYYGKDALSAVRADLEPV
jgi:RecB family exonuclease